MTANVCKKITAQLTGAIGKQEDVSVQLEALDILSDMLSRYQRISFKRLCTAGGCTEGVSLQLLFFLYCFED